MVQCMGNAVVRRRRETATAFYDALGGAGFMQLLRHTDAKLSSYATMLLYNCLLEPAVLQRLCDELDLEELALLLLDNIQQHHSVGSSFPFKFNKFFRAVDTKP